MNFVCVLNIKLIRGTFNTRRMFESEIKKKYSIFISGTGCGSYILLGGNMYWKESIKITKHCCGYAELNVRSSPGIIKIYRHYEVSVRIQNILDFSCIYCLNITTHITTLRVLKLRIKEKTSRYAG